MSLSSRSLLSKWCFEYMAPVVVTTVSAEVENVCLKNGLLFHELLSAFGHLDNVRASLRSANQTIPINDAHIRFERVTEAQIKSAGGVEESLRSNFQEFDMTKLPLNFEELTGAPPSGWTHDVEQRITRSCSFSEFEMVSQPICILTVVSTSDTDPVACMQELCSPHHLPKGFKTGQYDTDIQRVYLIIHDNAAGVQTDTALLLRQMKSKFSPTRTKLLCINSLPETAQNYQQPDLWTRCRIPMYFPQHAPALDPVVLSNTPINPSTNMPAIGSRLSMEDFMSLRNYCIELYQEDLLPSLERRIAVLSRIVNDTKKGVKNVLKNFWRKPREESSHEKGSVRYRFDRVESQILLLADTAFSVKDFDVAMSNYKLVRDDFKADKSALHVTHCNMMIAACQFLMDPMSNRGRELISHLDAFKESLSSILDSGHVVACYSVLLAELYTAVPGSRFPLEAATVLLQASSAVSRLSLLSALLTEKAALFCLQAGQQRKYSFHHVLSGNKFYSVGGRCLKHAMVCYASVLLLHEPGRWAGVKSKLYRILADELKTTGELGSKRSMILMLRIMSFLTDETCTVSPLALSDSVSVLYELLGSRSVMDVEVFREWKSICTRQILLGDIPVSERPLTSSFQEHQNDLLRIDDDPTTPQKIGASEGKHAIINDVCVPNIILSSISFLEPTNGIAAYRPFQKNLSDQMERLRSFTLMEQEWVKSYNSGTSRISFAEAWVKNEQNLAMYLSSKKSGTIRKFIPVPLGESLVLKAEFSNRFPVELQMRHLMLILDNNDAVDVCGIDVTLQGCETRVITLTATPRRVGNYKVVGARWYLGEQLQITQPLEKPGPKLQKTLKQRINGDRGSDDSLSFEVVPEHPRLRLDLTGIKYDVIQGELVRISLSLTNDGAIAAGNIVLKLSSPCFIFECEGILDFTSDKQSEWDASQTGVPYTALGGSSTVIVMPQNCVVPSGAKMRFFGWMKLETLGLHVLSIHASYYAARLSGMLEPLGPSGLTRVSSCTAEVYVKPSIEFSIDCHACLNKKEKMIMVKASNKLPVYELPERAVHSIDYVEDNSAVPYLANNNLLITCDFELAENEIRVECIWLLGAAKAAIDIKAFSGSGNQSAIGPNGTRIMNPPCFKPSESYCTGIVVDVPGPNEAGAIHNLGNEEMTNLFWGISPVGVVGEEWRKVLDRFLNLSDSNIRFQAQLETARAKLLGEQASMADAAPRTISQVRKDNQDNKCRESSEGVVDMPALLNSTDVQWISDQGVIAGEVIVAFGWVCRHGGVIRRGVHVSDALPVLGAVPSRPSVLASDFVSVRINHGGQNDLKLPASGPLVVPVMVELRSTANVSLSVDVDALDTFVLKRIGVVATGQAAPEGATQAASGSTAFSGNELFSPVVPVKGIRWEGKLRYKNLKISPFEVSTLQFAAVITRTGVFDLKNFHVVVRFEGGNSTEAVKSIYGQNLVFVQ